MKPNTLLYLFTFAALCGTLKISCSDSESDSLLFHEEDSDFGMNHFVRKLDEQADEVQERVKEELDKLKAKGKEISKEDFDRIWEKNFLQHFDDSLFLNLQEDPKRTERYNRKTIKKEQKRERQLKAERKNTKEQNEIKEL